MTTQDVNSTDALAYILGLRECHLRCSSEPQRLQLIQECNRRYQQANKGEMHPDISRFLAFYIPSMMEKLLNPPESPDLPPDDQHELRLYNAYFFVFWWTLEYPYMQKYLRSKQPEAVKKTDMLIRVLAQRFLDVASIWDHMLKNPSPHRDRESTRRAVLNTLQVLTVVMATLYANASPERKEELLPEEMLHRLHRRTTAWMNDYHGDPIHTASLALTFLLIESEKFSELKAWMTRKKLMSRWDICFMPGCIASKGLKECAKCRTVRYCSVAHQREHWKYSDLRSAHRGHCFETAF